MELDFSLATSLILAAVLGFAIGLQREIHFFKREDDVLFTGARSFAIIALLGLLASHFKTDFSEMTVVIAVVIGALLISSYIIRALRDEKRGTTTEFAAVAAFVIGMLVYDRLYMYATFTAVIVIFILDIRGQVLQLKDRTKKKDLQSMVLFLLITFVILPVLPNETVDPYGIVNPYIIWIMVILISGLSFAGYIAARIVGTDKGMLVTGFFGGFVSSTVTTIALSKKANSQGRLTGQIAASIGVACTTMYVRLVIVTALIDTALAVRLAPAFLLATVTGYLYIFYLYKKEHKKKMEVDVIFQNPLEMREALKFGILFGLVFGATSLLQAWAGDLGVYISALASGLTDVDAITLSLSTLYTEKELARDVAVAGIVIATFSNSLMKLGISYVAGNRMLGNVLAVIFAVPLMTIVVVMLVQEVLGL